MHRYGNDVRYLYAEPLHCVCIFIGTQSAYQSYLKLAPQGKYAQEIRSILSSLK